MYDISHGRIHILLAGELRGTCVGTTVARMAAIVSRPAAGTTQYSVEVVPSSSLYTTL